MQDNHWRAQLVALHTRHRARELALQSDDRGQQFLILRMPQNAVRSARQALFGSAYILNAIPARGNGRNSRHHLHISNKLSTHQ
jgi:hypothetical protein